MHEIERLLATRGVIARRDHPELDTTLQYLVRRGDLIRVLPGIYAARDQGMSLQTRVSAVRCFDPDAILVGAVAARLSFWPELQADVVECAVRHSRAPQTGYRFTRRHIPSDLVVSRSGLRLTSPALTALDLCATHGGDAIDQALRSRATTLAQLHRAMELTAARVGTQPSVTCYSIRATSLGLQRSANSTACCARPESPDGKPTDQSSSMTSPATST